MKLTVGPLQFHWPAEAWSDFYARLADEAPVERVVIGELVCSKREPFRAEALPAAIERLERAGKTVVLTSLALVTLPRERRAAADLFEAGREVEINDLTLMRWAGKAGASSSEGDTGSREEKRAERVQDATQQKDGANSRADRIGAYPEGAGFSVGPLVNVYNESTLAVLAASGARGVCLPPELPFASVARLAEAAGGLGMGCEVFAFGRVPLAISARCYHARVHGRSKDSCQFVCEEDPDGLVVRTLDGQDFLAVNGVQTLSYNCCNLAGDVATLAGAGVSALRLSPHSGDFVGVTQVFREAADGRIDGPEAEARLAGLVPPMPFSRGFMFGAAGAA